MVSQKDYGEMPPCRRPKGFDMTSWTLHVTRVLAVVAATGVSHGAAMAQSGGYQGLIASPPAAEKPASGGAGSGAYQGLMTAPQTRQDTRRANQPAAQPGYQGLMGGNAAPQPKGAGVVRPRTDEAAAQQAEAARQQAQKEQQEEQTAQQRAAEELKRKGEALEAAAAAEAARARVVGNALPNSRNAGQPTPEEHAQTMAAIRMQVGENEKARPLPPQMISALSRPQKRINGLLPAEYGAALQIKKMLDLTSNPALPAENRALNAKQAQEQLREMLYAYEYQAAIPDTVFQNKGLPPQYIKEKSEANSNIIKRVQAALAIVNKQAGS